jgi:O-antigen/teichoic acid export membrane protein
MQIDQNPVSFVTLLKRLVGYLSGDSLNYLLGFVIYAWLIRCLTNEQYGYLSVATSIYQPLLVVVALGLDLIGPRVLAQHPGDLAYVVARVQSLRVRFALFVCLPVMLVIARGYLHQPQVAVVLLAGFCMVLARAFDISYVAIALAKPKPLVYSRAFGLLVYLVVLLALRNVIAQHVWAIPVLNAAGVMAGRLLLMRWMRLQALGPVARSSESSRLVTWRLFLSGARTGIGQLVLFSCQTLDVVLLNRYVDAGAVGQYAMVSRLYIFGTAVLTCVLNAFLPELIASMSHRSFWHRQYRFTITSAGVGVLGALAFYFVGAPIAELLGGRPLHLLHLITPVYALVFLSASVANPFVSLLPSLQLETEYLAGVVLGGLTIFGSDLLLIPRFGVSGAAWGQLVGAVALGTYSVYLVRGRVLQKDAFPLVSAQAVASA